MKKRCPSIERAIIAGVARGAPVADMCRKHGISRSSFAGWLRADRDLADRMAAVKRARCDRLVEECRQIADEPGGRTRDDIRRAKQRINARFRTVARLERNL